MTLLVLALYFDYQIAPALCICLFQAEIPHFLETEGLHLYLSHIFSNQKALISAKKVAHPKLHQWKANLI